MKMQLYKVRDNKVCMCIVLLGESHKELEKTRSA